MQYAKDSFYVAMRDRLAALDPSRTVVIAGRIRPAVLVEENEPADSASRLPNAFYLAWGPMDCVREMAGHSLMKLECRISYDADGAQPAVVDRGRALTALDCELLRLLLPPRTPKCDQSHTPVVDLGSVVCWTMPQFGEPKQTNDGLHRTVDLSVFFFSEEDAS